MNIEVQVISRILEKKDMSFLTDVGIDTTFFNTTKEQLGFINHHKNTYGVIPDPTTFKEEFPQFPLLKVTEPDKYLIDKLQEQAIFNDILPHAQQFGDMLNQDSNKAVEYMVNKIDEAKSKKAVKKVIGHSYVKTAQDRYNDYDERSKVEGLIGISTGVEELDNILGGIEYDDFIAVVARPNVGKSWFGSYLALSAKQQGKKVGIYSGEMDVNSVGKRIDTLASNISNRGIQRGKEDVRSKYKAYLDSLTEEEGDILIVTTEDFGHREPTAQMLKQFVTANKLDLLVIDQMSLMQDMNRSNSLSDRYNNVVREVHALMKETKCPIVMLCQAGRKAMDVAKAEEKTPELHHIEYCDRVGQFITKGLSLNEHEGILRVCPKKNRNGAKNEDILLKWDKDCGYIEPMLSNDDLEEVSEDYGF